MEGKCHSLVANPYPTDSSAFAHSSEPYQLLPCLPYGVMCSREVLRGFRTCVLSVGLRVLKSVGFPLTWPNRRGVNLSGSYLRSSAPGHNTNELNVAWQHKLQLPYKELFALAARPRAARCWLEPTQKPRSRAVSSELGCLKPYWTERSCSSQFWLDMSCWMRETFTATVTLGADPNCIWLRTYFFI